MSNIKYVTLSAVCDYCSDRVSATSVTVNNYISTENMLPNKGGIEAADSVPELRTFSGYSAGDILLSNIRPYFQKIWFADRSGGCSNDVLVLRAKENTDAKFLYYVLSDNNFFNYDTVTSKGTKMPRGSKPAIMKYLVPDIDLPIQKRIADIFSAYDNLIENNNRRIALLEKAARELYKEWFVRFRFPGYETVMFEDGLPVGWTIRKLETVSDFVYGKLPEQGKIVSEGYPIFTGYRVSGYYNDYMFSEPMLIVVARGVGGTGDVKLSPENSFITNLSIIFLLYKPDLHKQYLYQMFSIQNLRYLDTGAAQSQITIDNLKSVKVIIPSDPLLVQYNNFAAPISHEIELLRKKNQNLARQRDLLLPRLMSGKLEV